MRLSWTTTYFFYNCRYLWDVHIIIIFFFFQRSYSFWVMRRSSTAAGIFSVCVCAWNLAFPILNLARYESFFFFSNRRSGTVNIFRQIYGTAETTRLRIRAHTHIHCVRHEHLPYVSSFFKISYPCVLDFSCEKFLRILVFYFIFFCTTLRATQLFLFLFIYFFFSIEFFILLLFFVMSRRRSIRIDGLKA